MKRFPVLALVLVLLLTSCSTLDLVSKSELKDSQKQTAEVQAKLDEVNLLLEEKEREARELQKLIGELDGLLCTEHSWEEASSVVAVFFPFDSDRVEKNLRYYVAFTQWLPDVKWRDGEYSTTLLIDVDGNASMMLDTEEDCVIVNPELYESEMLRGFSR